MNASESPLLTDWGVIDARYTALHDEALTPAAFPGWLSRWSDLEKEVVETYTLLKRASYQHTDDEAAARAYNVYVESMFSTLKVLTQRLIGKVLAVPDLYPPPAQVQLLRRWRNEADLYRDENVALHAEIERYSAAYRETMWTISTQASAEAAAQPGQPGDQSARVRAAQRLWLQKRAALDEQFLTLLRLRRRLAHNAGLPDYRSYRWRELNRLDYTPTECQAFHAAVAREIVPLVGQYRTRADNHPPAPPALDAAALADGVERILGCVDGELAALFSRLRAVGFLDLGERPGRAPVDEEWFFPRTGLPFLMLGTDLFTLLHEFGHGFHDYTSLSHQQLIWNMGGPDEFQEFAAMSMMMLAYPYLAQERGGVYSPTDAALLRRHNIMLCVTSLPRFVMQDAFEHWVYGEAPTNVGAADLDAMWLTLSARFLPHEDWSGREAEQMTGWQRGQWSLFRMPFYMISYPLAVMGAFQVWRNALSDQAGALRAYKRALAAGHTRSLPELYDLAGARLPVDGRVVGDVARFVAPYLAD